MLSRIDTRCTRLQPVSNRFLPTFRCFSYRHKVIDLDDAVALVKSNDTLCVSGFVTQSCPDMLLRALSARYEATGEPRDLRLLFGGGPGDFYTRGLNYLHHPGMLRATIGSHYGQIPRIADRVLDNAFPGYAFPLGSISRMIRATAGNAPGFLSRVGLGTFVDPRQTGGSLNAQARAQPLLSLVELHQHQYIHYPAFPIQMAFIRATTADEDGNLTFEHESILVDAKVIAMAARSSGGLVIAQVERIASQQSLHARHVNIPGIFVDCVVVCDPKDDDARGEHWMSFQTRHNPFWTGEIRQPVDELSKLNMSGRKIIARRAAMELLPDDVVNLGIGMPEGVASVALEEGIFKYVTLTTEAGVNGGIGASGLEFGPSTNPESFNEMNQQFDLYNGGGLSICFLGLAQCDEVGNVNVSRISSSSLTGPGGFMDIVQCTQKVVFVGTFMKKGLELDIRHSSALGGPAVVRIVQEGKYPTFIQTTREITFAAKQALMNGQRVLYITERCVFELNHRGLKLIEIAPGIDLQQDILDHMTFKPYIKDPENIPGMDERIFRADRTMGLYDELFSIEKQFPHRLEYHADTHTLFIDLKHYQVQKYEEIDQVKGMIESKLRTCIENHPKHEKVNVVVNYDGFDCKVNLTEAWSAMAQELQREYYHSAKRYSGKVFMRQKLGSILHLESTDDYWESFTQGGAVLSRRYLVSALREQLHIKPKPEIVAFLMNNQDVLMRDEFQGLIERLNYFRHHGKGHDID